MADNIDPAKIEAAVKAARAAAGLPQEPDPVDDPQEELSQDKIVKAMRKAAGLPSKTKGRERLQE